MSVTAPQRESVAALPTVRNRVTKLCFLIRWLGPGGAERQLLELVKHLDKSKFQITVLVCYDGGLLQSETAGIKDVQFIVIGKRGRWDISFFYRLLQQVKQLQPDMIHGYLGTPNFFCVLLKQCLPSLKIIWGVRDSDIFAHEGDYLSRLFSNLECALSDQADLVIANSKAATKLRLALGYPKGTMAVVHNGIDTQRFFPASRNGDNPAEWPVDPSHKIVGLVGRLVPMKDHETFLRAAALVACEVKDVSFVCVGRGPEDYLSSLRGLATKLGIGDRIVWAGVRDDMRQVYISFTVHCSASAYGEGFGNAIGEAMACGIPCVATSVGDSAEIVGDTGVVVQPRRPEALAGALLRMLTLEQEQRRELGARARQRIVDHWSCETLADRTAELLEQLM